MAKKLTSSQSKPAIKKVKKYSLAGYNLSGLSQAPQASYYLGKAAAEEAGQSQNVALEALKESQDSIKEYTEQQKKQQESAIKQSSAELANLAFSTGKDIVKNRAAKKAAELAAKNTGATVAANVASAAAPGAFMSGVASYGQPVAAALSIGGSLIKNTGGDDDPTTFTQNESNRYGLANIMEKTGQFAGYGSMLGPYGTVAGAVAGLGYGIYDTIQDNKKARTDADRLAGASAAPMAEANNAFINSKMMDAYAGGNQMARYGGKNNAYEFGGSYNDIGGTRYVDGGKIKPIPNSNGDVYYEGQTHEEGGIDLGKRTEVEDGESGTKINGTQYFFSRVLKTPKGEPYSQAHKAIASNPSLDPISKKNLIKDLAREQEVTAGRDPKQIARSGGMQMYVDGGKNKDPKKKSSYKDFNNYTGMQIPEPTLETFGPSGVRIGENEPRAGTEGFDLNGVRVKYRFDPVTKDYVKDPETGLPIPFPVDGGNALEKELLDYNFKPEKNIAPGATEVDPKKLDLSKTWLEEHPGFLGGLAQLAGPAYAMLKPYQKTKGMATAQGAAAPKFARVDKSGEMEDARRQQNAMNTYLKNTNLGPGKIIAMQSVATKTSDELRKISDAQDRENRLIKNLEAQTAAEVAGRNQAAELEASKANMMADINQNQYMDERNLAVAETFGKDIAGISMDQRKLDMQYKIARGLDKTGSLGRYEIMEQLRKQSKDPESAVYQKSEAELQQIASELGYKVVEVLADDKETKRLGGMARKYTSRLGDLSTKRNTTAKQSI